MDESVAVAYPEGALGRRPQETSRSAPEPRGGSGSLHLPDARASVWDRVGHRAETRRDHRSATSRGAGRTTGLDSGRQHDLPFRYPRDATGPRSPRAHPRDEERGQAQADGLRRPGFGVQFGDPARSDRQPERDRVLGYQFTTG